MNFTPEEASEIASGLRARLARVAFASDRGHRIQALLERIGPNGVNLVETPQEACILGPSEFQPKERTDDV